MQLSQKAINEFKQICLEEMGKKISDAEANEKGLKLLELFKLIYKPVPKDEYEELYKDSK